MEKNPLKRIINRFFPKSGAGKEPDSSVRVASVKDLTEGQPFCADAGGKEIALIKLGQKYHAIENTCPHLGGPLCKGAVADGVITCPWHGSKFAIDTGAKVKGPAMAGVKTYPVEVRGDDIYVKTGPAEKKGPVAARLVFTDGFDPARPFGDRRFFDATLAVVGFPFKLYGVLPFVTIAQGPDEIDLHLGEVHVTEMDLLKLSERMKALNEQWKTSITYCLYHSSQFPGAMLLNIRGPQAPSTLSSDEKFGE
ncbi:MAG TPA: Rieske 2Fe-2S domain-containing protein [Candidatus Eisenbacteria bacterium]|nr:Rieske 2Fe-2S domain-containing protein [Candidatus Eisenbacteria bacterium]